MKRIKKIVIGLLKVLLVWSAWLFVVSAIIFLFLLTIVVIDYH